MRSLQSSAVLLTLTSLGLGQEVYRRSECSHDSQCITGPGRCVEKTFGLFCGLFNNCRRYGRCVECTEDSHCKQFYNLDDCINNYCFLKDYFRNPNDRQEKEPIKIPPGPLPIYPRTAPVPALAQRQDKKPEKIKIPPGPLPIYPRLVAVPVAPAPALYIRYY